MTLAHKCVGIHGTPRGQQLHWNSELWPVFTNQILALSRIARSHEMPLNKLVRRSYWLDMNDRTLVMVMVNGVGAHLTNDEKRAHLTDLKREHLIDQVCVQEILPPGK